MVPPVSIAFMAVTLLVSVLIPVVGMAVLATRTDAAGARRWPGLARAFWYGALAFTLSQVLTRLPLMALVVPQLPDPVSGFLLSYPVASFTAGLFEETGRLLVMLWLMKAFHRWADGVAFGLGHGGLEAVLIVGLAMVNNMVLAVTINAGQWDTVAAAMPPEAAAQLHAALVDTAPWTFLLGGVERLAAVTLHIACSLLVLGGIVVGRKLLGWVLAVLLHGLFNLTATGLLALGVGMVAVEAVLVVLAGVLWVGILRARPVFPTDAVLPERPVFRPRVGGSEVPPAPGTLG